MYKSLAVASLVLMLGSAHMSHAQSGIRNDGQQLNMTQRASLERDYEQCIGNPNCSMQARLRIMVDMNDKQGETLRNINQTCIRMDYTNCIGIQVEHKRQWRNRHSRLGNMMGMIDPYYQETASSGSPDMFGTGRFMSTREPAAGTDQEAEYNEKNWWSRLWDNREEPEIRND